MYRRLWLPLLFSLAVSTVIPQVFAATVDGELYKWHPVEIDFAGPFADERDASPNPFLDYRLSVELTSPSGKLIVVPGFFAGDGQGNGRGNVWRLRFSADEAGQWRYRGQMRSGSGVAVSLSANEGASVALADNSGEFQVAPTPHDAPGFLRHGRLEYVGNHYLKFRDGPYWIKGGTDSPENLLGFAGIDGTVDQGGINGSFLHDYAAHRDDFVDGDPFFTHSQTGVDSRGLIGALNYLGAQGVNSVFFLPMNLGGDGQDTYPFVGALKNRFDKTHYDISKLYQWNRVLDHAQRKGIALNIVLSETEQANELWLDDGALGVERKLFFRELVARFGYLLAVKWNLGEENDFPRVELDKHADYIRAIDWSGKPIAVHTHINQFYRYGEIVGDPRYSASSIQYDEQYAGQFVEQWRTRSANAGHPWVLDMDENTNGLTSATSVERRKQILYDVLFSGGNIEWYFGYHPQPEGGDIDAGDFRQRETMWQQMRLAREMMQNELPFWKMEPADWRVSNASDAYGGAEVFALTGEYYAIYLPQSTGTEVLNTGSVSGRFGLRWFDPRTGQMINGSQQLNASDTLALGAPPYAMGDDWVVLISRLDQAEAQGSASLFNNEPPGFGGLSESTVTVGEHFFMTLTATDNDGSYPSVTVGALPAGMRINGPGNGQLELDWVVPANAAAESVVELIAIDAMDGSLRTTQRLVLRVRGADEGVSGQGNSLAIDHSDVATENAPPVFVPVSARMVKAGDMVTMRVEARDTDGVPPALIAIDAPAGTSFVDNGDGTRTFVWQTAPGDEGLYDLTFLARDHVQSDITATLHVEILVTP